MISRDSVADKRAVKENYVMVAQLLFFSLTRSISSQESWT